jgi:hypothetical protein
MKYAIIENGIVVNIVVASPEFAAQQGWIECPEGVGIGWTFDGVMATPPPEPESTPQDLKLIGIEINGIHCSATRNDQDGLTAVAMGVTLARMAGEVFPPTVFYFENGSSIVIKDDNFDSIYAQWVPFRQSFFAVNS